MRTLTKDEHASAIPVILFILTIFVTGALYTLFFIEIGFPLLDMIPVPTSPSRTLIMSLIYGIPLIVLIVGIISLWISAMKKDFYYPGGY